MKAHIFIKEGNDEVLLAKVANLEVIPRGLYVIDGEVYQYTGQPTFIIEKVNDDFDINAGGHVLKRVEIVVEKKT